MENVLGLLLFVVYIVCVIAVAAGVTWIVVRVSPSRATGNQAKPSSS